MYTLNHFGQVCNGESNQTVNLVSLDKVGATPTLPTNFKLENKMEKVTIEQVDSWLSLGDSDWNKLEILEDLMNLANGEYKPEVLRDDILQGYYHSNKED